MTDPAIRIDSVSKRYRIGVAEEPGGTLAGRISAWLTRPAENLRRLRQLTRFNRDGAEGPDLVWALRGISLEVSPGEVLGVIGRNGAGKSTLLKILSRITPPTSGRVELHGRVSSLLEVGTGFHPELTGRENVFLNGTILGMTRNEIERRFEEIVAFSGVERFIDTPVKWFSSGMRVRLAFAVAAHLEPEILLVDEVLAVGDAEFQKKCIGKMESIATNGRTVLFVSHNMVAVQHLCERVVVLEDGMIHFSGPVHDAIDQYLGMTQDFQAARQDLSDHPGRFQGATPVFTSIRLTGDSRTPRERFHTGDTIVIETDLALHRSLDDAGFTLSIDNSLGQRMCNFHSGNMNAGPLSLVRGRSTVRICWEGCVLLPGVYSVKLNLWEDGRRIDTVSPAIQFEILPADFYGTGKLAGMRETGIQDGAFLPIGKMEVERASGGGNH